MATEFLLLGPLTVRAEDAPVQVLSAKNRALLAALLLRSNHVVTVDDLAGALWGEDLPAAARTGVQNHVMRLRQSLGPAGARIATQQGGYLIRVEPGELDVDRFEDLLRGARTAASQASWPEAAGQAAAALALWRGEPLADVGSDLLVAREGPRLAELRLQALETRIGAELQLGRPGEVIGELRQLAGEHPLRERLHALLMLALYRDGRQAEALAAYQHARRVLIDELGAEPGPDLRELQQQILAADPALAWPSASATTPPPGSPVPRELPGDVAGFTGRAAELLELDMILLTQPDQAGTAKPTAAVISALSGTAGVGKTALAVHWAHQVADRFPDGQLYVNLRGYDPGQPMSAADALAGFLRSLGVAGPDIPNEETERAARYRSLLAGKRTIVVLDNASTVEQVRPLLPGHAGSAVVVTSRNSLAGLVARDGARRLDLDLLPLPDAIALLRELIGRRVDTEPDAALLLADQCARLPLALRVAAELAAARASVPLAALVTELADQQQRLDLLHADGDPATNVRAVFSWSYAQLSDEAARMFRLLGLHPGPDISVPAAASLAAVTDPEARRQLGELTRAHLIAEHVPGRFSLHDLLRAYATDQARARDSQDERDAAVGRLLDHYLRTGAHAARLLNPAKEPVALPTPRPGSAARQLAGYQEALSWFEEEHQVLLAAVSLAAGNGFDAYAWQLPWALEPFQQSRGHFQERAATQGTALAAATRLGDVTAQAVCTRLLGIACNGVGDHDQAIRHLAQSLALYQRLGNRLGQAKVHQNLGFVAHRQGSYSDALDHVEQAWRLYQAAGDKRGEAEALSDIGWYHGLLGDYQQAREFSRKSLSLSTETGHRRAERHAWDSVGYAEYHLGNLAEATACCQRALSLHREAGDRFYEADTLNHLGDIRHTSGESDRARKAWEQALAIFEDLQHPDAEQVRAKLASTTSDVSPASSA